MTRRFTGFDDWDVSTIGTNEPGWSVRGGGAPTFKPAYAAEGVVPRGERYCEFLTDSTADYRFISNDAIDADANRATFSIVAGFTMDLTTVEEVHLVARAVSTTDFLRARIVKASGNVYIDKMVAGAYTAGSGASAGNVTLTAGHSYLVRFDGNAGAINLKVWDAALGTRAEFGFSGEPAAYNLTPTGMTPTAAGWLGFGGRHSTLTGKIVALNFFASGTNGDAAVCPVTDAEYNAWLAEQSVRRVITMTLRATGYDSSGAPYTKKIKAQMSNAGYNAHEQDGLANTHFQAVIAQVPDFNVELPGAFSGAGSVSIGELVVRNPRGPKKRYVNYALQSCAFDTAPWGGTATVTTGSATPPTGCTRADTLTDASAVAFQGRVQTVTVGNDSSTYWLALFVKKTTGGTAKTFGLNFILSGGTAVSNHLRLNTDTGAIGNGIYAVADAGDFWQVRGALANNSSGNTSLDVTLLPATATWPGADSAATTGSVTVSGAHLWREPGALYVNTTSAAANFTKAGGIRDDWLRYAWDRDPAVMRLGDPAKPWHDHRVILRGRVGMPTAPSPSRIAFKMADLSDILNQDINATYFTSGDYSGQRQPELIGSPTMIEPPLIDATNLIFQLSRRATYGTGSPNVTMYDNGIFIGTSPRTIIALNTGTDEIQFDAAHGMLVGSVFKFFQVAFETLPTVTGAALAFDVGYFVASVPATDKITLSRTYGGATIDFTSAGVGPLFMIGYGYRYDPATAQVTLVASPAGRVTATASDTNGAKIGECYAAMAFTVLGLSLNYKDQTSFAALDSGWSGYRAGMWIGSEKKTAKAAFDEFANATFSWYVATPDGRLQVGHHALPSASATYTLTEAEVLAGSMQIPDVLRPVDMSVTEISYAPFFMTAGMLQVPATASLMFKQNKLFLSPYSYGATSTPIENYPTLLDANRTAKFETYFTSGAPTFQTFLADFHRWKLGTFALQTRLRAVMFKLGATVRVQHGRLGWEIYNAGNPASPDNTATLDSELAVIVGKRFQFKKPHPIELKLLRPIHANFPTTDITADT